MTEFTFVLLIPVVILIWKGIRIVPQGEEWVVERLGKFSAVLGPGLREPVSFQVHKGEILGLFGLVGAGRTEFARSLFGRSYGRWRSGQMLLRGKPIGQPAEYDPAYYAHQMPGEDGGIQPRAAAEIEDALAPGGRQPVQHLQAPGPLRVRDAVVLRGIPIEHEVSVQSIPPRSAIVSTP